MCTGTCYHSICEQCFDKKLSSICPVCEKVNSFEEKNINYQAIQLMKTLKQTYSLSKLADVKFDFETLTQGACSECKKHEIVKLRICTDCSKKTNLLMRSDDGTLELTTETSGELLETKILRIKSIAVCSDCALDGKHKGHKTIFIKDIRKLKFTSEGLHFFSFAALSILNIDNEVEDSKHYRTQLRLLNFQNQNLDFLKRFYELIKKESSENDEIEKERLFLFNLFTATTTGVTLKHIEKLLQKSTDELEAAENTDEKKEWQKTVQKMEKLRGLFTSQSPQFEVTPNDFLRAYNIFQTRTLREFFDIDNGIGPQRFQNDMRVMYDMTADVRRAFKFPPKYQKYANFAGSCIQFLFGGEQSFEDPALD